MTTRPPDQPPSDELTPEQFAAALMALLQYAAACGVRMAFIRGEFSVANWPVDQKGPEA